MVQQRPFGHTGIATSEIGLGCWQLGNPAWDSTDVGNAQRIVHQALDEGCTFFDTAPGYAGGQSEELLGAAIKSARNRVSLCTKFGHDAEGNSDFSAKAVRPALEASLRRLQTDYIDFYLLHNPPIELMRGDTPLHDELEKLKAEGKLRAYGVSLDHLHELETVIENSGCQAVEVLFNVFHQEPLAAFARARAKGIGLIVKVPLDSGWLSGKYRGNSTFTGIRERWSPEIVVRRAALVEKFAALVPPGVPLAHAALQYILAHEEISTIIPGAKNPAQAKDNFAAANSRLPAEVISAIHTFWQLELKSDPLPW